MNMDRYNNLTSLLERGPWEHVWGNGLPGDIRYIACSGGCSGRAGDMIHIW